jgi:hypothetical protein
MIVQDDTLSDCDFHSFVREGCSLVLYSSDIINDYKLRQSCASLQPHCDRVIMISSLDHLVHIYGKTFHPSFITLSDCSHNWLRWVKSRIISPFDDKELSQHLKMQQLWKDGELIGEWYQPLIHQWDHFIEWLSQKEDYRSWLKQYLTNDDLAWLHKEMRKKNDSLFIADIRSYWLSTHRHSYAFQLIQNYRLVPNEELKLQLSKINSC